MHQLTTRLAREHTTIVVEDLNVAGMRTYKCTLCGLILDRDLNAARNLAAHAAEVITAGSGPAAGRGATRKTSPARQAAENRQPGTAPAGQTGTARPKGRTAA
ncbi:zinc ribbon domain-containing protein [Paractinoplanes atraurantiacus]|uniref:zinc ribbon domain-containing protein n=1 Tax=Paractinoplanes atraurantiacus TaxID=1036182 RepID=UPI0034DAE338